MKTCQEEMPAYSNKSASYRPVLPQVQEISTKSAWSTSHTDRMLPRCDRNDAVNEGFQRSDSGHEQSNFMMLFAALGIRDLKQEPLL